MADVKNEPKYHVIIKNMQTEEIVVDTEVEFITGSFINDGKTGKHGTFAFGHVKSKHLTYLIVEWMKSINEES